MNDGLYYNKRCIICMCVYFYILGLSVSKSEDLWNPYKDLKGIVWKHLNQPSEDLSSAELENILRKHKQSFFSLLKNPVRKYLVYIYLLILLFLHFIVF